METNSLIHKGDDAPQGDDIHNLEEEPKKFITIDDLQRQAQELLRGLQILGEYRHPLEVRKGRGKEVNDMTENPEGNSRMLKAGKKTYFFDIKETKEGKPYLLITESWFKDDQNSEPDRNNIIVFPEQAKDFALNAAAMLDKIIQE